MVCMAHRNFFRGSLPSVHFQIAFTALNAKLISFFSTKHSSQCFGRSQEFLQHSECQLRSLLSDFKMSDFIFLGLIFLTVISSFLQDPLSPGPAILVCDFHFAILAVFVDVLLEEVRFPVVVEVAGVLLHFFPLIPQH